tara:strand:- start:164 stop:451 length:288 start_codon:yes stop_codon:yes gene_type:complete
VSGIGITMGLDSRLDVPQWIIETKSIDMTGKWRTKYQFKADFRSPPVVTASAMSPSGEPLGNADVHIVSVTKKEVDISINAYVQGMQVQLHAIGK